jgi:hypothetical protein
MQGGGAYIVTLEWGKAGLPRVTEWSCRNASTHGAPQPRQVPRMVAAVGLDTQLRCVVCMGLSESSWREKRCAEVATWQQACSKWCTQAGLRTHKGARRRLDGARMAAASAEASSERCARVVTEWLVPASRRCSGSSSASVHTGAVEQRDGSAAQGDKAARGAMCRWGSSMAAAMAMRRSDGEWHQQNPDDAAAMRGQGNLGEEIPGGPRRGSGH